MDSNFFWKFDALVKFSEENHNERCHGDFTGDFTKMSRDFREISRGISREISQKFHTNLDGSRSTEVTGDLETPSHCD